MYRTPKRSKLQIGDDNQVNITTPKRVLKIINSVDKGPVNGSFSPGNDSVLSPGESRRGRPRAEFLNTLMIEGSTSPSSIKCSYCNRVFPREKSLQAHRRTHTGEKPYECDYPRCNRKFAQSGQLKTHQRLHTGEKPFICSVASCENRFTHANRHCSDHPDAQLKRFTSAAGAGFDKKFDESHNNEVKQWHKKEEGRNKRALELDTTPTKLRFKQEESSLGYLSSVESPKSELDDNLSVKSEGFEGVPARTEALKGPKKRWLRAVQEDQKLFDSSRDLAQPINWDEGAPEAGEVKVEVEESAATSVGHLEEDAAVNSENQQNRPTVLVCVQGGKSKQVSSDDMQGAIALVELKNGQKSFNYRL